MSYSRRVYSAIKQALTQLYPDRPQGNSSAGSLFQLGLRLLDYLPNHDRPIPNSFALEPESVR